MTIEKLTAAERAHLRRTCSGFEALRIIDAQAARIAELETLLQRCQNEAADTWGALVTEANARIEELLLQLRYRCPALVAELDAANARADAAGCEWRKAEARVAAAEQNMKSSARAWQEQVRCAESEAAVLRQEKTLLEDRVAVAQGMKNDTQAESAALRAEIADMRRSRDIERAAAISNGLDWAAAERKGAKSETAR